ncbi:C-type lectin domain family 4 member A-like [Marmota monax]|uniref:C-type lectin domain family 4 member A-like n=1 Tax=Marmota monax TaxID=9995 RepID=UPI001EB095DD|nr:C-type lectin domain family 4 member A-like [Marmota monax]
MALGTNYAEVSLQNELKSSGTNSNTPAGEVWSCCPENWKSFSSSCYFFSTDKKSWKESQENCSRMEAHLVVINSKEEQDFITQNMDKGTAYFVGLSDPEDRFWYLGEPSNSEEHCVVVNYRRQWGWNYILCESVEL